MIACIPLAWLKLLALDGGLAKAEPKTLRYRILHAAALLARTYATRTRPSKQERRHGARGALTSRPVSRATGIPGQKVRDPDPGPHAAQRQPLAPVKGHG